MEFGNRGRTGIFTYLGSTPLFALILIAAAMVIGYGDVTCDADAREKYYRQ